MDIIIKHKKIALALIVILGFLLRFVLLGANPPSLNWDETSIGYNAYSILKTGKDEYGNFLPLSFRSFDDFKPPVYIYLTVPSVAIFGLTEFAVRFPAAILGVVAVIVIYYLTREVFSNFTDKSRESIALLAAFFLAVSPWHLQFSRAAYEGNVGLFFILLGTYLFFKSFRNKYFLYPSTASFILSLYSYHSFRLIVPIYMLFLLIVFWKRILRFKKETIISALVFFMLAVPVYISFINPQGTGSRLSMVSIFSESDGLKETLNQLQVDKSNGNILGIIFNNRRFYFAREMIKGYLDHFSPNFWYINGAGSFHHHPVNFGMDYIWGLPFLLAGFYFLMKKMSRKILTILVLLLLAPLPASLTTGTPHGVRAIAMIPGLVLLTSTGVYFLLKKTSSLKKKIKITLIALGVILFCANFLYYINQYYFETPRVYGYFWEYGNKESIEFAKSVESKYDKIVMTYAYDQPYIYYLFYNEIDPSWYQKDWKLEGSKLESRFSRSIGKYEFRNIDFSKDSKTPNTLLVGTPSEISSDKNVIKKIYYPDGKVAYKFYSTDK